MPCPLPENAGLYVDEDYLFQCTLPGTELVEEPNLRVDAGTEIAFESASKASSATTRSRRGR